jgi:hypothetical protein
VAIGVNSIPLLEREYARALSLGDKKRAATIRAQAEAILGTEAQPVFQADSGTFQAEPGLFSADTGTLPNDSGRF